ncbi:hypothetical protein N7478_001020 [Penicillium angulare]|uniref:uncharacterized protein n=1 Tax=Penicillium angulare TaxID=116970 RepID=UPI0025401E36|nr:uncharacterized protein N7478_001020 [Penicillium angulare]KAJ5291769.1 hypothetical protein N7478_001020 [Penicillium angulare]
MTRFRNHVPPLDSPSKQLILDLAQELEQTRIFEADLKRVHAYERKTYYENLERIDREREAVHSAALDEAVAFHDRIREEAEALLRDHNRAEEEQRRQREEAARKERERIEREKAEKLRRQQEEAARLEAERKAKEAQKKKAEEDAERARRETQERQEREQRQKLEKEEAAKQAEKRAKEEEAKKAQQAEEEKARAQLQQKTGGSIVIPEELKVHERYLELHKTLKEMRKWLTELGKTQPEFKKAMGDLRRSITKSVGQLRVGKGTNTIQMQEIRSNLQGACKVAEPTVDIRRFLAFPPEEIAGSEQKIPALLIYGLNILAKRSISALVNEGASNPQHAEPVGILIAQIFSYPTFLYKDIHLSDILWAKYRVVCPPLWGFTGSEKTESGRRALGWWKTEEGFVSEQTHFDRMGALGAGFSAITLRNFGKSPRRNPFPTTIFWNSLHKLLSVPPKEIQDTQIIILQSMLRHSGDRILGFFGQIGVAVIRKAVVDLPRAMDRSSMSINQLKLIKELYLRENHILL